ncbi:Mizu-kussei [Thalictrum thalictroides]|uniref:Mizu-kussei n=1 Tax=Thalictrum thalictroides TaxID=46969 RepID=A0A7J6VX07_THATH|nr:Mizu-kussei [Thalictrum thalictroides]
MKKIESLRRFLLPCITPTTISSTTTTITTKKRLSTSLRDDIPEEQNHNREEDEEEDSTTTEESVNSYPFYVAPRSSKSMVIGTLFGHRKGHVCFCIQHDRLNCKPSLFLEFSIPTYLLVKEMQCGLVRIALECTRTDLSYCPLHSIPIWGMCINGRKVGFASRRKTSDKDRLVLKTMQSTTVGAGVIPMVCGEEGELIYMRANYERVIGNANSESFYLINPDGGMGQEFSVFLMRST